MVEIKAATLRGSWLDQASRSRCEAAAAKEGVG
jgi:hypothetical protein